MRTATICTPHEPSTRAASGAPRRLDAQRNLCTLAFSGPADARVLRVSAWDAAGTRLWQEMFPATRLRTP